jgi:hypothetical protein
MSDRAQRIYFLSLTLAEDLACKGVSPGRLAHPLKPLTLGDLALEFYVTRRVMAKVVDELLAANLWVFGPENCYEIARFAEETTPKDPRAAKRVRDFRDRESSADSSRASKESETGRQLALGETEPQISELIQASGGPDVTAAVTAQSKRERIQEAETPSASIKQSRLVSLPPPDAREAENRRAAAAEILALDFARWFVATGIESQAIPPHVGLDPMLAACREDLAAATQVLETYGRDECETRARRLFAGKTAGEFRYVSISVLAKCWGGPTLSGTPRVARGSPPRIHRPGERVGRDFNAEFAQEAS